MDPGDLFALSVIGCEDPDVHLPKKAEPMQGLGEN